MDKNALNFYAANDWQMLFLETVIADFSRLGRKTIPVPLLQERAEFGQVMVYIRGGIGQGSNPVIFPDSTECRTWVRAYCTAKGYTSGGPELEPFIARIIDELHGIAEEPELA